MVNLREWSGRGDFLEEESNIFERFIISKFLMGMVIVFQPILLLLVSFNVQKRLSDKNKKIYYEKLKIQRDLAIPKRFSNSLPFRNNYFKR